jgi:hypothetical protein
VKPVDEFEAEREHESQRKKQQARKRERVAQNIFHAPNENTRRLNLV